MVNPYYRRMCHRGCWHMARPAGSYRSGSTRARRLGALQHSTYKRGQPAVHIGRGHKYIHACHLLSLTPVLIKQIKQRWVSTINLIELTADVFEIIFSHWPIFWKRHTYCKNARTEYHAACKDEYRPLIWSNLQLTYLKHFFIWFRLDIDVMQHCC